jgi:SAM-dependent methyltransferase
MNNWFYRFMKRLFYRGGDILYALFPKRQVLKICCGLTSILRTVTWRLACRYYGCGIVRYRGGIEKFVVAHIKEGDRVLDIGCAEGYLTRLIAKKAKRVVALEIDRRYIDAIDKSEECFRNVEFIVGDAFEMDFREKFDVIVLVHTIEHMAKSDRLLKRLSAIAKKIIIETPDPESDWISKLLEDLGIVELGDEKHVELFSHDSLKERLERNGWKDVTAYEGYGAVRVVARSETMGDVRN